MRNWAEEAAFRPVPPGKKEQSALQVTTSGGPRSTSEADLISFYSYRTIEVYQPPEE